MAIKALGSGWVSSEFWMALAALAGKLLTVYFVIRTVSLTDPNSQSALIQAITMAVMGIGTVVGIAYGASNYTNNRTELKAEAVRAMGPTPPPTTIITRP